MTPEQRIERGLAAVRAGDPDYGLNEWATSAGDAIANILHAYGASDREIVPEGSPEELAARLRVQAGRDVVENAMMHFEAETMVDDIEEGERS